MQAVHLGLYFAMMGRVRGYKLLTGIVCGAHEAGSALHGLSGSCLAVCLPGVSPLTSSASVTLARARYVAKQGHLDKRLYFLSMALGL